MGCSVSPGRDVRLCPCGPADVGAGRPAWLAAGVSTKRGAPEILSVGLGGGGAP